MESLYEMEQNRSKAEKRHYAKRNKLRKQIAELEEVEKNMKYPHLLGYLKKLGNACLPLIDGAVGFSLYGPFGMSNQCSIYFHGKGKEKNRKTLGGATFQHTAGGYGLIDHTVNTGKFKKGTIGEANGMNHPTIEITKEMTIEWFAEFAKKGY